MKISEQLDRAGMNPLDRRQAQGLRRRTKDQPADSALSGAPGATSKMNN